MEGLACIDPGARTPIGVSGNLLPWYEGRNGAFTKKHNIIYLHHEGENKQNQNRPSQLGPSLQNLSLFASTFALIAAYKW
jgi:hypothetical protein